MGRYQAYQEYGDTGVEWLGAAPKGWSVIPVGRLFWRTKRTNFVEKELMQQGYYDIAKSYILYRYEHAKEREEKKRDILEKIERNDLSVTKRSGGRETFSIDKLRRALQIGRAHV